MKLFATKIVALIAQGAIFIPSSFGMEGGGMEGETATLVAPLYNQYDLCTDFCKGAVTTCEGVVDWVTNTYPSPTSRHVSGGAGTSATGKLWEQFDACHNTCMTWMYYKQDPHIDGTSATRYFNGYIIGDSLNCRYNHLQLASGIPSFAYGLQASESESAAEHCNHITPDGGWVCTDVRNEDGKTPIQIYKESTFTKHRLGDCWLAADDTIADCHRKGLSDADIDQNLMWLPDDIEYIMLQANALTMIPDLSRFTKLKGIYLDNNVIDTLVSDDFASNTNLEILSMTNNFITEIPDDILTPLTKLKAFFISYNYVESISPTLFSTNVEIEMIAVLANKLERFEPGTFDGLSALQLLAFGRQGKGPFTGRVFKQDGIPDGLFDDLVSLEFLSTFINDVTEWKSSWFGEWSAKLEVIDLFFYFGSNPTGVSIENGVFDKLPNLIKLSIYSAGRPIFPAEVANNTKLRTLLYGFHSSILAPLPLQGVYAKPELIPPSSTPTPAPVTPTSAAPSDAPTMMKSCVDSDKYFRIRNKKTGKRVSKDCNWVKKAVDSRCVTYPEAAENCPKSCGMCGLETVNGTGM